MRNGLRLTVLMGSVLALPACMDTPVLAKLSDVKPVAFLKDKTRPASEAVSETQATSDAAQTSSRPKGSQLSAANKGDGSELIAALSTRRSVLDPNSGYAQLARALLDSSSGVAQAELRAAKLRSVARDKNWLPTIGPSISLNALGELAAGLLVEQVLYDNGRKKAERALAAADVEVSAVALSQDANDRVHAGLELLVIEAEAREKAEMAESGLGRMREFNRVISERVKGGLSSLSDERVVQSKVATMEHEAATHREAQRSAAAELASMISGAPVQKIPTATPVRMPSNAIEPLTVTRARAEARRADAEADMQKAALLPTLSASGILGKKNSGSVDYQGSGLGVGTKAEMQAAEARAQAMYAKIDQAREDAARNRARIENSLVALQRKERDAADLVQQARGNYRLFQDQFEAGKKTVMDVLAVYEEMVRRELEHLDIRYDVVQTQLEAARLSGVLASGSEI